MIISFKKFSISLNPKSLKFWFVFSVVLLGVFLIYLSQQSAQGVITVFNPKDIKEEESKKIGTSEYQGKHFSFPYPNTFYLKTNESTDSGMLEKVVLLGAGTVSKKLAVTAVETSKGDTFDDVSGVKMRRLKLKIYQEKPLDISGQKGVLFEKKEETFEKTAFILKDKILVTVALTSANRDSELEKDFDSILKNLTFLVSPPRFTP